MSIEETQFLLTDEKVLAGDRPREKAHCWNKHVLFNDKRRVLGLNTRGTLVEFHNVRSMLEENLEEIRRWGTMMSACNACQ